MPRLCVRLLSYLRRRNSYANLDRFPVCDQVGAVRVIVWRQSRWFRGGEVATKIIGPYSITKISTWCISPLPITGMPRWRSRQCLLVRMCIVTATPPSHLDWNLWQGPVPDTEFRHIASDNGETKSWSRCHYEFRWWYEYSGGKLTGRPVDDLKSNPLPDGAMEEAYKNRTLVDHFRNFFEAVRDRKEPISDVFSHHRALSTCHLAGIAARLNRKLSWDPTKAVIIDDPQAQKLIARDYRKGFEIARG